MKKGSAFTKTIEDYLLRKREELTGFEDEDQAEHLKKCQSPIEQLLFMALTDFFKNASEFLPHILFSVEPQYLIVVGRKEYKTDLFLQVSDCDQEIHYKFAIECDGHDFHEKTKDQVRKDRKRERGFMKKGFTVIRFSGSEIYEDPDSCALEAWEICKGRMNRK